MSDRPKHTNNDSRFATVAQSDAELAQRAATLDWDFDAYGGLMSAMFSGEIFRTRSHGMFNLRTSEGQVEQAIGVLEEYFDSADEPTLIARTLATAARIHHRIEGRREDSFGDWLLNRALEGGSTLGTGLVAWFTAAAPVGLLDHLDQPQKDLVELLLGPVGHELSLS